MRFPLLRLWRSERCRGRDGSLVTRTLSVAADQFNLTEVADNSVGLCRIGVEGGKISILTVTGTATVVELFLMASKAVA
jgi:hypothetical protein